MTRDEFNTKVIEGLENLQAYVDSMEFQQLVLDGEPMVVDHNYATKAINWGNKLQLNIYIKMGKDTGLLSEVNEESDGFSTGFPDDQPAHIDALTAEVLHKCGQALRDQIHYSALAGATQAQQLQGVRLHVAGMLLQSRLHLAGAHDAPAQH